MPGPRRPPRPAEALPIAWIAILVVTEITGASGRGRRGFAQQFIGIAEPRASSGFDRLIASSMVSPVTNCSPHHAHCHVHTTADYRFAGAEQ